MTKDEKRQNILEAVGEMTGKLLDATTASIEVRFKKRSVNVAPIAIQETLADLREDGVLSSSGSGSKNNPIRYFLA